MPKKMTTEGPMPMSAPETFRKSRGFTSIGDRYNSFPSTSGSKARDLSHTAGTYVDWAPLRSFPTPVNTPQKPKLQIPNAEEDGARHSSLSDAAAFASPAASAYSESFQDCHSEVNSVASCEADDGSVDGENRSRANSMRDGEGSRAASDDDAFAADWYSRFQEEHQRRLQTEEEVATLRESHHKLEARLELLEHQVAIHQAEATTPQNGDALPAVELPQTVIAREVGAMMGRAVGGDEAARAFEGELAMLHQRIERLSGMEAALERKRIREKERHDNQMKWLGHVGLAVGCVAAGALGVYLVVNRPWTSIKAPSTTALPPASATLTAQAPAGLATTLPSVSPTAAPAASTSSGGLSGFSGHTLVTSARGLSDSLAESLRETGSAGSSRGIADLGGSVTSGMKSSLPLIVEGPRGKMTTALS